MINIALPKDCCGCEACSQICPKQCISMKRDTEGFLYPKVDTTICIECGLCEKVCPIINQFEEKRPSAVYAAKNNDELERLSSSSGGIFILVAKQVISEGGVVFGARFDDNWNVLHDYCEIVEELSKFQGSKYVQSRIGDSYKTVEKFLKNGRKVLFSGTSFTTTAFAPTLTLLPTLTFPITFAPQVIITLFPIIGAWLPLYPIVTCWLTKQCFPIFFAAITVAKPCCINNPGPISSVQIYRVGKGGAILCITAENILIPPNL